MYPKHVSKSLSIALEVFPQIYQKTRKNRGQSCTTFHFSFLWQKNKRLVAIGTNSYIPNSRTLRVARKFGVQKFLTYKCLHSEIDAIQKCLGRIHLDRNVGLVNIRLNHLLELQNSFPCSDCQIVLDGFGIKDIWFSTKSGLLIRR